MRIEKDIETHLKKYEIDGENFLVTSIIGQVGEGTADPSKGQTGGNTPNKARITVDFVKFQDRLGVSSEQELNDIRNVIKGYPGVSIVVDKPADGPPTGSPINLEIKGDDYTLILKTANQLKSFINTANIPGIEELKLDIDQGKPELLVNVDRQKARRLGVSTGLIGNNLRTALYGKEISTFKDFRDDYPINIRLKEEYRYDRNALLNQKITFRDQGSGQIKQVPISAVATTQNNSSFSASISVFLSLIGVLFGLLIFRMDFVILMTMIGIISLAGIVVNNAIVLIDYINLIIDRKRKTLNLDGAEQLTSSQLLECIVEGGKTRLRPVLLTAMTTILGLLPLALGININFKTLITELNPNFYIGGENVAFWGPMGWAIIYGLSFATFLTLVVVPILYYLINKIKTKSVNVAA